MLHTEFPGDLTVLDRAVPRYEWMDGWQQSTSGARRLEDLPREARAYLDRMHELIETPITYVSVGTRRDQIIGSVIDSAHRRRRAVRPRGGDLGAAGRAEAARARGRVGGEHDRALSDVRAVLLHGGEAVARRSAVRHRDREADAPRRAGVLPRGRAALRDSAAPVRARDVDRAGARRIRRALGFAGARRDAHRGACGGDRDGILRVAELPARARRGSAAGDARLSRGSRGVRSGRGRGRRRQFGGRGGARSVAIGRARHARALRSDVRQEDQAVGASRLSESREGGEHRRAVEQSRAVDRAGRGDDHEPER